MMILLSPAKKLQVKLDFPTLKYTQPAHLEQSEKLVRKLRKLSVHGIQELMDVNRQIAAQNFERFARWQLPFTTDNAVPAIYSFNGDVYLGFDVKSVKPVSLKYAQEHLRILSGLYGILRPLDLIQPYRLEMGIPLRTDRHPDLYSFWRKIVNNSLSMDLDKQRDRVVVNLASNEYFTLINPSILHARIISISFKEWKNSQWNIFFVNLKRARGMMARFIIENKINNVVDIQGFDSGDYHFNHDLSSEDHWVFTR